MSITACRSHDPHDEQPPAAQSAKPVTANMVRVPAGSGEAEFYIDRTEVTIGDYTACEVARKCAGRYDTDDCNEAAKSRMGKDELNYPMDCIRVAEAQNYCAFVGKRLPTRVEWLRAARGDSGQPFPWGSASASCDVAILADDKGAGCGLEHAAPVGSRPHGASPYGALDMIGNVAEFVEDYDASGAHHSIIAMGGSYWTMPSKFDAVMHDALWDPTVAMDISPTVGFRCAWSARDATRIKGP